MTPKGTVRATVGKSQGYVLGVNCRALCTAALSAELAKPGVSVRDCVPAAAGAVPSAPFCTGSWVLILGRQCTALTQCGCKGREGSLQRYLPVQPPHSALPSTPSFPLVKPDEWQVLRKTELDISREHAATLPLQACKRRVEECPSTAMQPSDI